MKVTKKLSILTAMMVCFLFDKETWMYSFYTF